MVSRIAAACCFGLMSVIREHGTLDVQIVTKINKKLISNHEEQRSVSLHSFYYHIPIRDLVFKVTSYQEVSHLHFYLSLFHPCYMTRPFQSLI
jgi:hypothetical protein